MYYIISFVGGILFLFFIFYFYKNIKKNTRWKKINRIPQWAENTLSKRAYDGIGHEMSGIYYVKGKRFKYRGVLNETDGNWIYYKRKRRGK